MEILKSEDIWKTDVGCVLAILLGNYSKLALLNLPQIQQDTEIGQTKHVYRWSCVFPWSTGKKVAVRKLNLNLMLVPLSQIMRHKMTAWNPWIHWIENNSCDVKYQSLGSIGKEATHICMSIYI